MKKLTAGIFTALLGLVTVNAANAAIPSTNYVNEQVDAVRYEYKLADTTTLNSAEDYTDKQVGTLTDLTTTAKGNTVAAINEVNSAYKTADSNLLNQTIGTDAMGEIKTGENASVNPTTLTQAVNALNAKIDYKTSGIATDAALSDLTTQVNTNKADISDLEGRMDTAEGEIDALQTKDTELSGSISTNAAAIEANKTAIAGLGNVYDAKGAAAAAQEAAEAAAATYTDGQIDALAETYETKANVSTAVQEAKEYAESEADAAETAAKSYADSLASNYDAAGAAATAQTNAIASAKSYADTELAKKVNIAQGAEKANHVVITDASGNVTTSATITQAQVTNLTADLAAKMPLTTTDNANIGEDGTYVLTATTEGGVTTYKWEQIERSTPK